MSMPSSPRFYKNNTPPHHTPTLQQRQPLGRSTTSASSLGAGAATFSSEDGPSSKSWSTPTSPNSFSITCYIFFGGGRHPPLAGRPHKHFPQTPPPRDQQPTHRKPLPLGIAQDVVHHRRLARAEEPREEGDGEALLVQGHAALYLQLLLRVFGFWFVW